MADNAAVDWQPKRLVESAVEARYELLLRRVDKEERASLSVEELARALHDRWDEDVDVDDAADDHCNFVQRFETKRKVAARDVLVVRNTAKSGNCGRNERNERLKLVRVNCTK